MLAFGQSEKWSFFFFLTSHLLTHNFSVFPLKEPALHRQRLTGRLTLRRLGLTVETPLLAGLPRGLTRAGPRQQDPVTLNPVSPP